jgi:hypothetical protein
MNSTINNQQRFLKAQKAVKEMKGFYTHLFIYCIIIPIIIYINLTYVPDFHWFWFSLLGWGMGLFFHWLNVFGFNLLGFGKRWEEKKIQEFMNKNQ